MIVMTKERDAYKRYLAGEPAKSISRCNVHRMIKKYLDHVARYCTMETLVGLMCPACKGDLIMTEYDACKGHDACKEYQCIGDRCGFFVRVFPEDPMVTSLENSAVIKLNIKSDGSIGVEVAGDGRIYSEWVDNIRKGINSKEESWNKS